jgi:hypothetical protein
MRLLLIYVGEPAEQPVADQADEKEGERNPTGSRISRFMFPRRVADDVPLNAVRKPRASA